MVEFVVVAIPLLLAGLCTFETGRWLLMRQAAGYALFEAARAGTVSGADPAAMARAFERALAPALGVDAAPDPDSLATAVRARMTRWAHRHGLHMARIEQLSPRPASFEDFSAGDGDKAGTRQLDYDYQRLHHDGHYLARYRHGVGPRSGQTVFQANTLVLRLTYLHAPYLPGLQQLVRQLGNTSERDGYVRQARAAGLLVIRREIALPMQSPAREHGKGSDLLAP